MDAPPPRPARTRKPPKARPAPVPKKRKAEAAAPAEDESAAAVFDDAPLPAPADEAEWAYRQHALRPGRRVRNVDDNDDQCSVCGDGGGLLCCVSCPRSFHEQCVRDSLGKAYLPGGDASWKHDKKHQAADAAIITKAENEEDDDAWHCPVCLGSHANECLVCGEAGDGETRLVPCDRCPRAYFRRVDISRTSRGAVAAATWIVRRVAAQPRPRRG